eukprot:5424382-Karenia_brevis.AAC.1
MESTPADCVSQEEHREAKTYRDCVNSAIDGRTDSEGRCALTSWCASTGTHSQTCVPAGVTTRAGRRTEELDSQIVQMGTSENMTGETHSRLDVIECRISVNLDSGLWW